MELSRRGFFTAGAASVAVPTIAAAHDASASNGAMSTATLGAMLEAMGLRPKKVEQRYDFAFRSVHDKAEWDLSMTAVLSSDAQSIWIMAWLDELPKSATDIPRTALLRLLAANDRLGNGKFFAYIASNRRFVMQRVVPNSDISTQQFAGLLKDLGSSVVDYHPHWSTANWSAPSASGQGNAVKQTSAESR